MQILFSAGVSDGLSVNEGDAQVLRQRGDMRLPRVFDGGQYQHGAVLFFQIQEVCDGFLLRFALQFFVVAGYEGGEMLRGVFVVPAAQFCTGGDGFQPFGGGEFFFGYAARVEAVDEDGTEAGFGAEGIDALDGKHGRILGLAAAGRLKGRDVSDGL